ncbi:MAG: hypothetical protein ABJA20_06830 [Novosphingobium sp.]
MGSSPSTPATTRRPHAWTPDWWTLVVLAMAILACLPAIIAHYPQMTDYPAHLARWYVMLDYGQNPVLAKYYGFRLAWSGNLGADLLIFPLSWLFGLEVGGRIIVVLIPVLTGLGLISVERALRGRTGIGAALAMATIWSPALLMGFLNFTLSVALALFAFAFWVKSAGAKWRAAAFVPIGLLVWLCHQSGWGVLGVMVFAYEWRQRRNLISAALATYPLWLPIVPTLLAGAQAPGSLDYGKRVMLVKWVEWKTALRDQVKWLDLSSAVLFVGLPFVALLWRRLDGRLAWAALITAVLAIVIPRHLGGGDYADYRLIGVALMLGALAIDWRPPVWVMPLAALPFLVRLTVTTLSWQAHSHDVAQMLRGLDHVPRGARVASAVREPMGGWRTFLFGHIGCYSTVRRDALTNAHFAIPGVHMLELRTPEWNFTDPSQRFMVRGPKTVDLADFGPAKTADFLWYIGELDPASLPAGAEEIYRSRHSIMYRLHPAAAQLPAKPAEPMH